MGGIIQTVHVSYDSPFDTTTTGGVDTGLTATINMQSASNKLLITYALLIGQLYLMRLYGIDR